MDDRRYEDIRSLVSELTDLANKCDREVLAAAVEHLDLDAVRQSVDALRSQTEESAAEVQGAANKVIQRFDGLHEEIEDIRVDTRSAARAADTAGKRLPAILEALQTEAIGDAAASKVAERVRPLVEEIEQKVSESAAAVGSATEQMVRQQKTNQEDSLAITANLDDLSGLLSKVAENIESLPQVLRQDEDQRMKAVSGQFTALFTPLEGRVESLVVANEAMRKRVRTLTWIMAATLGVGSVSVAAFTAVLLRVIGQ